MFHELLESVKREVSGERALESVRALARFHRVQASPGYDAASAWLEERLRAAGIEVEVERVAGDGRTRRLGQLMPEGWACARATAVLIDGERRERLCDYEAEPLSLVLRSAPARGRFPLVAVGEGDDASHYRGLEVRGKVVLARGDAHTVLQLAVIERGAAGILTDTRRLVPPVRERHDETDAVNYTSFWWEAEEPRGWGFVVAPRVGDRLRERLAHGARLELEVEIDSRAFATPIPLLTARLGGPSDTEVVVVSHLCHPEPSANDNASGVAANLETARTLAALLRRGEWSPRRAVRFLWVPELTGTYAFFSLDPGRARRIVAALNLDMVGEDQERCGSTLLLEHPPHFAGSFAEELLAGIREQSVEWVSSYSGPGHYSMVRMAEVPYGGGSDHAVFVDPAIGVPCPMLIQWPDRFYHSSHDTPDKTDPRSLELAVRCAATYAGFLAAAGEREIDWLLGTVARGARRRLLRAVDEPDAAHALERERARGRAALSSLERLGTTAAAIERATRAFEDFAASEAPPAAAAPADDLVDPRVPRRFVATPLPFPRRLMPGWRALPAESRQRWRELDRAAPYAFGEVAWLACDGHRSVGEIARIVRVETGLDARGFVPAFFDLTTELGLSEWTAVEDDACNPNAPSTAGR